MAEVDALRIGRRLIQSFDGWTQGTFARDATGASVSALDENAVCFCALGALRNVNGASSASEYLWDAADKLFQTSPIAVNDDIGHAAVLQMYDAAIAAAEAEAR